MRPFLYGLLVLIVLLSIAVLAMSGQHWCAHGEKYQAVRYEHSFDKKGQPSFKPVYECVHQ